jgi:rhodanese-related sulfurtransferase
MLTGSTLGAAPSLRLYYGGVSRPARPVPAIGVAEAHRRLQAQPPPFVVDVREPWEYATGHLPGARLVPLGELERRFSEVPMDQPVLTVCQVGARSLAAAALLVAAGYPDVTNVEGGTTAWVEHGYPIERKGS